MKSLTDRAESAHSDEDWLGVLVALARFLRSPAGCPWDREQSTASFAQYLVEEARELEEAVAQGDNAHVAEELGDVLFCTLMTAVVAEDEGRLALEAALAGAYAKMVRRHGHIFGAFEAKTPEEVSAVWARIKAQERGAAPEG